MIIHFIVDNSKLYQNMETMRWIHHNTATVPKLAQENHRVGISHGFSSHSHFCCLHPIHTCIYIYMYYNCVYYAYIPSGNLTQLWKMAQLQLIDVLKVVMFNSFVCLPRGYIPLNIITIFRIQLHNRSSCRGTPFVYLSHTIPFISQRNLPLLHAISISSISHIINR